MAEHGTDRPLTLADLQAHQVWVGAEMKKGFGDSAMHVEVLRQEVKADLDAAMQETRAEIATLRRELADGLERVETKLLTSFHGWARTYESKSRGLSTLVVTFEERLSLAEDRLNRLERGDKN